MVTDTGSVAVLAPKACYQIKQVGVLRKYFNFRCLPVSATIQFAEKACHRNMNWDMCRCEAVQNQRDRLLKIRNFHIRNSLT